MFLEKKCLNYLQTVETLINRRVLRRLIWVCTVCHLPSYGSPGYNVLTVFIKTLYTPNPGRKALLNDEKTYHGGTLTSIFSVHSCVRIKGCLIDFFSVIWGSNIANHYHNCYVFSLLMIYLLLYMTVLLILIPKRNYESLCFCCRRHFYFHILKKGCKLYSKKLINHQ